MTMIIAAAVFGAALAGAFIGASFGVYVGGLGMIKAVGDGIKDDIKDIYATTRPAPDLSHL